MYSTLKPTIRFTRNTRCPCSNDYDDHGDFFSRHKAGPPDEPRVDGRWCDVQHQEHMTVQSSCTQNNMWIRHSSYSATFKSTSSSSPKILKTLLRMPKCSPFSRSTCFLLCPSPSVQIAYVCISDQRLSSSGQREGFRH